MTSEHATEIWEDITVPEDMRPRGTTEALTPGPGRIAWNDLIIGDIFKYSLKPAKGTGDEEEHYEIILSVSRDFAKTLNTKRTDQNKFARDLFSAVAAGRAGFCPKDKFFVLRDDETFRPLVDPEDLARWDLRREEDAQHEREIAQNLLSNLDKLAKVQERVNSLKADDGTPFEQLSVEMSVIGRAGKAGKAVLFQWTMIYGRRFALEMMRRDPSKPGDPACNRG